MISALFVETGGVYFDLENVDPWDELRDARGYVGPHAVVAHPPCQRWGRYWHGGPSARVRRVKGDDEGCFMSALMSVRAFGGVIEHPEASAAWDHFGICRPPRRGGWIDAGDGFGFTCCVEQGWYGHAARKATWLYTVGTDLPDLAWGPSEGQHTRMEPGFHSREERQAASAARRLCKRLSTRERIYTPLPFRDLLVSLARSVT